ncbi:hypothetical protein Dsin_002233 [Dipteronia sinensis]|uniref:Uncharacterized protein n=1 Tax=Dipteronia sinensis TaxID=43782 RepID=A0AAE0B6S4_9ROSI|nr:hypothetical protein Dsin_002233 [Dipteronia sinensis]
MVYTLCNLLNAGPAKTLQSNANKNKASKIYSKAEVFLHNKRTDCWTIIKNKVEKQQQVYD